MNPRIALLDKKKAIIIARKEQNQILSLLASLFGIPMTVMLAEESRLGVVKVFLKLASLLKKNNTLSIDDLQPMYPIILINLGLLYLVESKIERVMMRSYYVYQKKQYHLCLPACDCLGCINKKALQSFDEPTVDHHLDALQTDNVRLHSLVLNLHKTPNFYLYCLLMMWWSVKLKSENNWEGTALIVHSMVTLVAQLVDILNDEVMSKPGCFKTYFFKPIQESKEPSLLKKNHIIPRLALQESKSEVPEQYVVNTSQPTRDKNYGVPVVKKEKISHQKSEPKKVAHKKMKPLEHKKSLTAPTLSAPVAEKKSEKRTPPSTTSKIQVVFKGNLAPTEAEDLVAKLSDWETPLDEVTLTSALKFRDQLDFSETELFFKAAKTADKATPGMKSGLGLG